MACAGLSEVEMTPDLIAEVHRLSGGRMREVLNIIATIEQVAATNGMKRIDIADLEGIVLSHDWQNRTPRGCGQRRWPDMVPEHPLTHAILGALADGEEHFIRDLAATLDVSAKKIADSGGHLVRNGYATRGLGIYRATEKGLAALKAGLRHGGKPGMSVARYRVIAPVAGMEPHADKNLAERRRHAYDAGRRLGEKR